MEIIAAIIAGSAIGAVLGFIGAGGAMLSLPILIYIFSFTPHQATTAALAVVFSAALSGVIVRARRSEVLYRDAFVIWAIGLITNIGFSLYVSHLPAAFITIGFALILITAATSMLRSPLTDKKTRMPLWVLILISLVIGAITGIFGIGGGFLAIPVLVLFFGTPQSVATGTSLFIIAANSLTALLARHNTWHELQWHIPLVMAISAVIVAQLSAHQSKHVNDEVLRKAFAFLLYAIAVFTVLQTLLQF